MTDFTARITAQLDTKNIATQIKGLGNKYVIKLSRFALNTKGLPNQIQASLDNHKFIINLEGIKAGNIDSQMKSVGDSAGKTLAARINRQIANGGIEASLAKVTAQYEKFGATGHKNLSTIKADIISLNRLQGQLFSASAAGDSQSVISSYVKYNDTLTRVKNNLATVAAENKTFMQSLQIKTLDNDIAKWMDSNSKAVEQFGTRISSLRNELSILGTSGAVTASQLDAIKRSFSEIKVEAAAAGKTGTAISANIQKINSEINNGKIKSSIAQVRAEYEKLGATGHKNLSEIRADLLALGKMQDQIFDASAKGDLTSVTSIYEKYSQTLAKVKNQLKEVSAENKTFVDSMNIKSLDNDIEKWMERNTRATKDFGERINELRNNLLALSTSGTATVGQLNAIKREFEGIKTEATAAGKTGATFATSLKGAMASIMRYVTVSTVIYSSISALRQMYQNVYNVDAAMTELIKVTNETDETYSNFLTNAAEKAKEIGTTITGLVTSTASFARLGYSMGEAQKLAEAANIYAVVGDEIEDVNQATESVISTMIAFGIEASNSMSIIDKLNEVGNKFAISSGGIGEALKRSASSLATANNTIDQSIALITAGNTVIQDPEQVGNALKTISMRIRGAKTELEEAGESTDGMAESTAKLREEVRALSGIDIMLDDDTFKSTYDIMDELSLKWGKLTDIQQASLIELLAGKHRGNILSSLLENFDEARKALEASSNSEGSAMREHAKWMESLEAKVLSLKAAWEEFSQVVMDDSFLKNLVDTGTNLLSVVSKIMSSFGTLPVLIAAASAAMSIKNVGKDKMFSFTCRQLYILLDIIV